MKFATIVVSLIVGTVTCGAVAHDSDPRLAGNKRHANWRRQVGASQLHVWRWADLLGFLYFYSNRQ